MRGYVGEYSAIEERGGSGIVIWRKPDSSVEGSIVCGSYRELHPRLRKSKKWTYDEISKVLLNIRSPS